MADYRLAADLDERASTLELDAPYYTLGRRTFCRLEAEWVEVLWGEGTTTLRVRRAVLGSERVAHPAGTVLEVVAGTGGTGPSAAVDAHAVTQPAAHTITQPSAHTDHAAQAHSAHAGGAVQAGGALPPYLTAYLWVRAA